MKFNFFILVLLLCVLLDACKSDDKESTTTPVTELMSLDMEVGGSIFNTEISGTTAELKRDLPYNTTTAKVKAIQLSDNTTANIKAGDMLNVGEPISIVLTNSKTNEEKNYSITLTARNYASIVEKHGLLKTDGNQIVNKDGDPVSLAGNSFFWSNNSWGGEKYYTAPVVSWLAFDWETTIVRAAMGVDESGGYLSDKEANINRVKTIVDAAIDQGVYVIIDWHSHHAEDYEDDAIDFFKQMATLYGEYDNVIYEIYNEPLNISWSDKLKPYAENVIAAIRDIDADNMIVVGTPEWSQRVDLAAADPITSSTNIAYTLHFYTVNHKQWLRDRATAALSSGIALFITEWGSIGYTQVDPETNLWMDWCRTNKISHCNWSVNDKVEEWSILSQGANTAGNWTDGEITQAGQLSRNITRSWQE
jgi:endoglucanase